MNNDYHLIYLLIKRALEYKGEKQVIEGNSPAFKPSTCDDAFANYLISKSKNKQEAESYDQAVKLVLIMRDFLNKKGFLYSETETKRQSQPLSLDFTEV